MSSPGFSRYLLSGKFVQVYRDLAEAIGLNEAIFLQQLDSWLREYAEKNDSFHFKDGRWWIWNSYEEWSGNLPWWSQKTIQRICDHLRTLGIVVASDRYGGTDRRLWWSIDYDAVDAFVENRPPHLDKMTTPSGQNDHMDEDKMTSCSYTDNTTEKTTEELGSQASDGDSGFDAMFGPSPKAQLESPKMDWADREVREGAIIAANQTYAARSLNEPWIDWGADHIKSRDGVSAIVLRRVGWLVEQVTGMKPESDQLWKRWQPAYSAMYKESGGDWGIIEEAIKSKWPDDTKFRTADPAKYIEAVSKVKANSTSPSSSGPMWGG